VDRLVPIFELLNRLGFVTAPHAGCDDARDTTLGADGIAEVIAAIGAVSEDLAGIFGKRIRACPAIIDIGGSDGDFFYEGGTSSNVAQMATCLRNAARYWVKVGEEQERRIASMCRKVAVPTGGMTTKNRERLRAFDDQDVAREFLRLPEIIRRHVEQDKRAPAQKAVLAQVAAAIAILQAIPIRIGNLVSIDLHRHLEQQRKNVHLVIPEAETKNRQAIDFKVPDYALEILKWYIVNYRRHLVHQPTNALFPGRQGGPKTAHMLGQQIKQTVFKFTGLTINPHLFRHFAGKVFLDQQPGGYEVIRQVLGHKRIDTTTSFYAGAEVQSASTLFNDIIDGLRREHPLGALKKRKVRS
jgi:site-specific recombinase XerD